MPLFLNKIKQGFKQGFKQGGGNMKFTVNNQEWELLFILTTTLPPPRLKRGIFQPLMN